MTSSFRAPSCRAHSLVSSSSSSSAGVQSTDLHSCKKESLSGVCACCADFLANLTAERRNNKDGYASNCSESVQKAAPRLRDNLQRRRASTEGVAGADPQKLRSTQRTRHDQHTTASLTLSLVNQINRQPSPTTLFESPPKKKSRAPPRLVRIDLTHLFVSRKTNPRPPHRFTTTHVGS